MPHIPWQEESSAEAAASCHDRKHSTILCLFRAWLKTVMNQVDLLKTGFFGKIRSCMLLLAPRNYKDRLHCKIPESSTRLSLDNQRVPTPKVLVTRTWRTWHRWGVLAAQRHGLGCLRSAQLQLPSCRIEGATSDGKGGRLRLRFE